jgi:hypothetical protein
VVHDKKGGARIILETVVLGPPSGGSLIQLSDGAQRGKTENVNGIGERKKLRLSKPALSYNSRFKFWLLIRKEN